jgi:formate hydrogenlyase subunit 3/multisubunit Na+/H+ antiporter MnhD subunit
VNAGTSAFAIALCLAAIAAVAGWASPARWRSRVSGPLLSASGIACALSGAAALTGERWTVDLPMLLPLAGLRLSADALSGWFLLLVGAVTAIVGVYTIGYAGTRRRRAGIPCRAWHSPVVYGVDDPRSRGG